jgi:3-methyladenine DNA glycosylase AlkD
MKKQDHVLYEEIETGLYELRDPKNAAFLAKLTPDTDPERILGIKTPVLRKFAADLKKNGNAQLFCSVTPHRWLDEDVIHACLISGIKDSTCMKELERFLPYAESWVVTDVIRPVYIRSHPQEAEPFLEKWLKSDHPYTVRTAVGLYMAYYLDRYFRMDQMERIAALNTGHYYVHMGSAWYFATALAKQPDAALTVLKEHRLSPETHNRAIQKAIESYRVKDEMKALLRTMKRKEKSR